MEYGNTIQSYSDLDDRVLLFESVQMLVRLIGMILQKSDLDVQDSYILFGVVAASAPRDGAESVLDDAEGAYRYISLLSLAQLLELDRTTVRRRVRSLHERAFVVYEPRRGVRLSRGSMQDPSLHRAVASEVLIFLKRLESRRRRL